MRAIFTSRRMAVVFLLGFSSGLPLLLVGQTLQLWTTESGFKLADIAALSLIGLAYTFKFLWAPLLDRYSLPWLGRRRGWLLVFQLGLMAMLGTIASLDPAADTVAFAGVAVSIAVLSASQDIVIDAYNADVLEPDERILGSSLYVLGYRVAMLVASTLALIAADHVVWGAVYGGMAVLMGVGVIATLLADEPPRHGVAPRTLAKAVWMPFSELGGRLGAKGYAIILGFAATYKFGEQFAQALTMTFFTREVGFTNTDIALANKLVGFAAFGIGGALGGMLVGKYGMRRMLVAFGVLQASAHVLYLVIALAGKNLVVFSAAIFVENLAFAMATTAFVSVLMAVCNPAVSATQFALLTSLTSVGQRVFGWLAADVVAAVGWSGFFLTTIAMAIPGILLARRAAEISETARAALVAGAADLPAARVVAPRAKDPPAG